MNQDFKNLTQNIVDQKETNLCVPISVSTLIRWALKNDLGIDDNTMKICFSMETVLTTITMIVYPRSLAGLTLNPKKEEQSFQHTEIETLLKRLKFKTYFHPTGWDMIDRDNESKADFDFEQGKVTLSLVFQNFSLISATSRKFQLHPSADCYRRVSKR